MDVLPAIPDAAAVTHTAILLTDKQLREWQHSDPLAYVQWFREQCWTAFVAKRTVLAREARGTVDDVPEWQVRTTLHRMVQVLKRHRDVHFVDDLDDKPPSSLITTLAARAYVGETDLFHATMQAVEKMPGLVEDRSGVMWVPNPVAEKENFADKWREYPERQAKFYKWLDQVESDLRGALEEQAGLPAVVERFGKAFGSEHVRKAATGFADEMRELREAGGMKMAGAGILAATGATTVRSKHNFFGGPSTPSTAS